MQPVGGRDLGSDDPIGSVDLSTADGCQHLVRIEPRCDILVNNLGVYELKPFFDIPDEDWDRLFHTNIMSGVRLSRAYLPTMMSSGWGRVVFVGSVDGVTIPTDQLHYGMTKAAVLALSRGLAKVAQRSGVTVNAVLPGATMTERNEAGIRKFAEQSGKSMESAGEAIVIHRYPTSITQRVETIEDVVNLIVYLCSTKSSATTGSALRADGGI